MVSPPPGKCTLIVALKSRHIAPIQTSVNMSRTIQLKIKMGTLFYILRKNIILCSKCYENKIQSDER